MANATVVKIKKTVSEELAEIQRQNNGLLDPQMVVDYARNPETALHSRFEWDDTEAAEKYRLWQARQIIRMELVVIEEPVTKQTIQIRQYVSLPSDRIITGRERKGYREITSVLKDDEKRQELFEAAKQDMIIFKRKYQMLQQVSKVINAIDEILF